MKHLAHIFLTVFYFRIPLTNLHLTLCLPQYYEMSYGLNIEMHKQVRALICVPLVYSASYCLSLPLFLSLPPSHGRVLMYFVCAPVDVSLCVCANAFVRSFIRVCVCVWMCVYS